MLFLIWNHERQMYWKQTRYGYTGEALKAGRFTLDECIEICHSANITFGSTLKNPPNESMVPLPYMFYQYIELQEGKPMKKEQE